MKIFQKQYMILKPESTSCEVIFDIDEKEMKINELEKQVLKNDFWDDQEAAKRILKEKSELELAIDNWEKKQNTLLDLKILFDMAREENDEETLREIETVIDNLKASVRDDELKRMLSEVEDSHNAIMTIHSGAGGTEAQDWTECFNVCT